MQLAPTTTNYVLNHVLQKTDGFVEVLAIPDWRREDFELPTQYSLVIIFSNDWTDLKALEVVKYGSEIALRWYTQKSIDTIDFFTTISFFNLGYYS